MRMKKIITLCVLILLSIGITIAQTDNKIVQKSEPVVEGTYQIQVVNSRNQPNIPGNIKQLVLENRATNEVKYVTLGTEVRIMILPTSEITKPDFKPIKMIAHVAK